MIAFLPEPVNVGVTPVANASCRGVFCVWDRAVAEATIHFQEVTTVKKAILAVSFGTSHNDTREKTIDRIENALAAAFPDRQLYRAWTSGMIIRKVKARDGVDLMTVKEAAERMLADGVEDVIVQPTHILNGVENDIMTDTLRQYRDRFRAVRIAAPLLTSDEDVAAVVDILSDKYGPLEPDTALVFMGHGTTHYVNTVYAALDYRFKDRGYENLYMGTVEAYPALENVLGMIRSRPEIKKVVLAPFMIVAGDHAKNDLSGDDEDSWKSVFTAAGYEVRCELKGIGEFDEIAKILVDHAKQAEQKNV